MQVIVLPVIESYNRGFADGEAYGREQAQIDAFQRGHELGCRDAKQIYEQGYRDGEAYGRDQGQMSHDAQRAAEAYQRGHLEGSKLGYQTGRTDGYAAGREDLAAEIRDLDSEIRQLVKNPNP